MANDYINEVLPRWRFWKEFLIAQLERYRESVEEEYPEILEIFDDETVEKLEKTNTAEELKQVSKEIFESMWSMYKKFHDYEYMGVYETDITNRDTLLSWLTMESLIDEEIKSKIK